MPVNMKNLPTNQEAINRSSIFLHDLHFQDFINRKIDELFQVFQREALKDSKFIPNDFFITSDFGKRKAAISSLLILQDSTFSFLRPAPYQCIPPEPAYVLTMISMLVIHFP
jgi:hypothetical protein